VIEEAEQTQSTLGRLKQEYGRKGGRFVLVSGFNVLCGQTLLIVALSGFGWTEVWANVFAVGLSAVPAYILTRYWVWEKRGKNHFLKEVVPFWSLALIGLALSTLAAYGAQSYSEANDFTGAQSQVLLNLSNLCSFGIVWVAKFFILDRILFAKDHFTGEKHEAASSTAQVESAR
jgi:putative flippase GtrA